jgi:hypothetical protein
MDWQRNPQTYLNFGTNAGVITTVPAESGKIKYISAVHGATDKNHATIEIYSPISGTVATTSGSKTVTGTGTDFINELYVGACIRINDNSEILYVDTITSKTAFEATANSANNEASSGAVLLLASMEYTKGSIDGHFDRGFRCVMGKSISAKITESTSACSLGVSAYST